MLNNKDALANFTAIAYISLSMHKISYKFHYILCKHIKIIKRLLICISVMINIIFNIVCINISLINVFWYINLYIYILIVYYICVYVKYVRYKITRVYIKKLYSNIKVINSV